MSSVTRRAFVRGAAAIPFAIWFEEIAEAQPILTRFDAFSPQGNQMLNIYRETVTRMRNIAEGNPRSWTFQWYTHFVRGDRTKSAELTRIYPSPSTFRNLANEMWNTCQAHSGQPEDYFLPWHRMFVFFFESIIRRVSGNAQFTLPYWNYSVSGANHGRIPPPFRIANTSLFVNKRSPGVNTGQAIDQGQPGSPLSLVALRQCIYSTNGAIPGFCRALDSGLHGNVHVLTGNSQNMGAVPWAAFDPIFWLHHSNIDRLWASWNAAGRRNPTGTTFLNKTFIFADGNGNRVVARIRDFLDIAPLRYKYDRLEPVPACPPGQLTPAATAPRKLVATKEKAIALTAAPLTTRLEVIPGPQASVPLAQRIDKLAANKRLYLVIRDLKTNIQPEVLYHLYLELPATAPGGAATEHWVGNIHFFEAGHHDTGGADPKFFSFDITDLAKSLRAKGLLKTDAELTIAPAGTPASKAQPVIGEVSLVEQ